MNKLDLVREWFEFAANDLRVAKHLSENMYPKPIEIVCYHCQQAVEKALKGYLIDNDVEPPYIHDLDKLCLMCIEYDSSFDAIQAACEKLNEYITAGRYPSTDEIVETDAVYALKEADKVYTFCADLIPELRQEPEQEQAQNPQQSM